MGVATSLPLLLNLSLPAKSGAFRHPLCWIRFGDKPEGHSAKRIACDSCVSPENIQKAIKNLPIGQRLPKGTLVYKDPIEQSVPAGSSLLGTDIEYVGLTNDKTAEVRIGGQRAFKRSSDSLQWTGSPVEGVDVQLRDRMLWFGEARLQLAGTIHLTVKDAAPQADSVSKISDQPTPNFIVYKLPVVYRVKRGETIPGTTLTYVGKTEKG